MFGFFLVSNESTYVSASIKVDNLRGMDDTMGVVIYDSFDGIMGVSKKNEQIPDKFILCQNYPNPFNPTTTINYSIPRNGEVSLKVYNLLGKEVETLYSGFLQAGNYVATFSGSNLTSGVYFYRLQAGNLMETKRLVLLK